MTRAIVMAVLIVFVSGCARDPSTAPNAGARVSTAVAGALAIAGMGSPAPAVTNQPAQPAAVSRVDALLS